MGLTGNELWVIAGTQGETVWVRKWGAKEWWPIVDVELGCGLIIIDVCGKGEVWDLVECAELRINDEPPISNDGIW